MPRKSLIVGLLSIGFVLVEAGFAQKAAVPKQPDRSLLARENVKELLLLMDTDKNGKISKQEWMKFMETEFDRLDKAKAGEVNLRELKESEKPPVRLAAVGK